ncbi:MAG: hypothetical protein HDR71_07205 [Lachnospiraceae bacterium]|nr:hypothetical protein [Lachnospiraceae bacterium]
MAQEQKDGSEVVQEIQQETVQTQEETGNKPSGESMFAGIYDRLPDISVKAVDRFIVVCVIALVAVILIGVLKAHHVF